MTYTPYTYSPYRSPREIARELLEEHLTTRQRETLRSSGTIRVKSPTGRVYTITHGYYTVKVRFIQGRRAFRLKPLWIISPSTLRFCVHFRNYAMPLADEMLAYKIMLESRKGERYFLRHANPYAG